MNFLVIGHTVSDVIKEPSGIRNQPGGIYYSVSTFLSVMERGDKIYLVSSIDEKNRHLFESLYDKIESDFIQPVESIPTVELKIFDHQERGECYLNVVEKLDFNRLLTSDIDFDGIYVNMITGTEMDPGDLKKIREKFNAPVYFDVHTLSRGIDDDKRRFFREIPDVDKWLANIDIIQMNESEMRSLGFGTDEFDVASEIFKYTPSIFILTKGEMGSRIFIKEGKDFYSFYEPGIKVDSVNNVGCGDIFGAVFFYSYIYGLNINESFRKANRSAGISTTYSNIYDLVNIKNDIDQYTHQ